MTTLKITKRQRELLIMDTYAEYPEGREGTTMEHGVPWGGADGVLLRDEIRSGSVVTVTSFLIKEVDNRADMDSEPTEQRVYRGLLAKLREAMRA